MKIIFLESPGCLILFRIAHAELVQMKHDLITEMKPDLTHTGDHRWSTFPTTREGVKAWLKQKRILSSVGIISTPSLTPGHVPAPPPALTSPDNLASNPIRELPKSDQKITANTLPSPSQERTSQADNLNLVSRYVKEHSTDDKRILKRCVNTSSSLIQEHVITSPAPTPPDNLKSDLTNGRQPIAADKTPPTPDSASAPPDKPLSHHMHKSSTDDQQCVSATTISSSSAQGYTPTSQSSTLRIMTPPDKLHPTLSCWIKNMSKLSCLVDRLQDLASAAPVHHRSQLLRQVASLRATSKKQQEHFVEFLQLSEEYANKYLLDISAEINQQSSFLDKLEGRLEAAMKLRGEAVDLKMFYESGTVATMKDLRATSKEGLD